VKNKRKPRFFSFVVFLFSFSNEKSAKNIVDYLLFRLACQWFFSLSLFAHSRFVCLCFPFLSHRIVINHTCEAEVFREWQFSFLFTFYGCNFWKKMCGYVCILGLWRDFFFLNILDFWFGMLLKLLAIY